MTLDDFKKEIAAAYIIHYMRSRWVTEKVKALQPANPDEARKLELAAHKAWLDSLRQQSYVKNFWEESPSH